jgi:hypothetical protein
MRLFIIIFNILPFLICAQSKNFTSKKLEFHYRAIYINSSGDTLTNELLVLKPLGRTWIAQPFKQKSLKYIYHTDSQGIKKYADPRKKEKTAKYDQNSNHVKKKSNEITGIIYNDEAFYMHPPRSNQYEMLFYAPHPQVILQKLHDNTDYFRQALVVPTWGRLNIQFTVAPAKEKSIFANVKLWSVTAKGKWKFKNPKPNENIYNSELNANFSKENGFTKLYYHFENGTKILFDLIDIKKP